MIKLFITIFLFFIQIVVVAQSGKSQPLGKVSYISSQNVYVKFETTKNIVVGDTLCLTVNGKLMPAMVVTNLSSSSCVCAPFPNTNIKVTDQIVPKNVKIIITNDKPSNTVDTSKTAIISKDNNSPIIVDTTTKKGTENKVKPSEFKQKITGSVSASSYSNFSNTSVANTHRFQYYFSLNAMNIANSKISTESYISFRHEKDKWDLVQKNIFQALKIYSLAVKYDVNKNTQISLGRRINTKLSSIGASDGVQYETKLNSFYFGALAGTRPNINDYKFDANLPQVGAYIAHVLKDSAGDMQNSLAFFEQRYGSKTDRRFAYFQQSNSLLPNLYFFGTAEVDLYKNLNDKPVSTFSLSSTYLSLSYRFFRKLSVSTTYDSRKNVIYYESYKSYIKQIIDIEARQGLGFQANYFTQTGFSIGAKTGYRFPNSNSKANRNLYGYVSYYNIPGIKVSSTLSATYLETSYINGKIYTFNLNRDFWDGNIYADLGYQYVDYKFENLESGLIQNVVDLSISCRFYRNLSLTINFEQTFEKTDRYSRLNFQTRYRF